ncbi:hypothetical protein QJS10_CPA10g00754 [Acorus calamus]|uniref:Uncharacterized protein n=1 Tax=Acorus calamus TaxID=4465 RepID=A0AAV9DYF4_ACOCL|nr:hypothetical protein QJS10_CPA10g00754 [Acorus calamus]
MLTGSSTDSKHPKLFFDQLPVKNLIPTDSCDSPQLPAPSALLSVPSMRLMRVSMRFHAPPNASALLCAPQREFPRLRASPRTITRLCVPSRVSPGHRALPAPPRAIVCLSACLNVLHASPHISVRLSAICLPCASPVVPCPTVPLPLPRNTTVASLPLPCPCHYCVLTCRQRIDASHQRVPGSRAIFSQTRTRTRSDSSLSPCPSLRSFASASASSLAVHTPPSATSQPPPSAMADAHRLPPIAASRRPSGDPPATLHYLRPPLAILRQPSTALRCLRRSSTALRFWPPSITIRRHWSPSANLWLPSTTTSRPSAALRHSPTALRHSPAALRCHRQPFAASGRSTAALRLLQLHFAAFERNLCTPSVRVIISLRAPSVRAICAPETSSPSASLPRENLPSELVHISG